MVFGAAKEATNVPKAIINWRIYSVAIAAAFAAVMIGYDSAFIGTSISLASFKNEMGLTKKSAADLANMSANIVSTYQAGAFFGALFGYPTGYYLGRKYGLLAAGLLTFLGSGITMIAKGSIGLAPIYAGRAIAGIGIGLASNLTPIYIAELAPAAIRGQLVGSYEIAWQIGGIVGFWINYGCSLHIPASHKQWFIPFAVQLIPAGLFSIMIPLVLKESPRWLIMHGKREKAIKSLSYLRKLPEDDSFLIDEINSIQLQVEHDRTAVGAGFWAPVRGVFTQWNLTKRLLITTSLFMWQNGTGINAVNYYSPTFFKSIGLTGQNTSLLTTGVFGVIKGVGALLWAFWWVDRYGRRAVLLAGSIIGAAAMLVIGIILGVTNPAANPKTDLPPSGAAAVAFFYIWTAGYAIGWNGTPWVVNSESFPGSVRMVAMAAAAMSNWLWNFVISRATPTMFLNMGHSGFGVYIFFGIMQILSIFYVLFLLPETKGIPLEAMDMLFDQGGSALTAHRRVVEQLDNERRARGAGNSQYLKPTGEINLFENSNKGSGANSHSDENIHEKA